MTRTKAFCKASFATFVASLVAIATVATNANAFVPVAFVTQQTGSQQQTTSTTSLNYISESDDTGSSSNDANNYPFKVKRISSSKNGSIRFSNIHDGNFGRRQENESKRKTTRRSKKMSLNLSIETKRKSDIVDTIAESLLREQSQKGRSNYTNNKKPTTDWFHEKRKMNFANNNDDETTTGNNNNAATATTATNNINKKRNHRRKHNYKERANILQEEPTIEDLQKESLHSNAVSSLRKDTPISDIIRAIKRARNLHDNHDIAVIGNFLINECNEHWGYGYRGSLLSRLAVAALHMNNHDVARKAIVARRKYHSSSMLPHESAAIVRGLLRVHNVTDAFNILEHELSFPSKTLSSSSGLYDSDTLDLSTTLKKEKLKHRALSLASIASRHFYETQPAVAVLACQKLTALGPLIRKYNITAKDLSMPWERLILGATECEQKLNNNNNSNNSSSKKSDSDDDDDEFYYNTFNMCNNDGDVSSLLSHFIDLPNNLVEECVLSAMETFPYDKSLDSKLRP